VPERSIAACFGKRKPLGLSTCTAEVD